MPDQPTPKVHATERLRVTVDMDETRDGDDDEIITIGDQAGTWSATLTVADAVDLAELLINATACIPSSIVQAITGTRS